MSDWMTTRRQAVVVHLLDGRTLRGDIHLQSVARHHFGAETPTDHFNRDEQFFFILLEDGQPLFVARAQVIFVELAIDPAHDDEDRLSAARRIELELDMADGTRLEGIVLIELPPDRLRALDFLNSAPMFFPIWTADVVHIVNRNHIRAASPLVDIKRGTA